ncbi:type II toxin-antitoxin system RelE family toxin [Dyadobacter aurulentus]|uniref:type II toxin-antitoxin system RelE family toxin n=1 Tax=Dyadobacter sp. UC 10 TaxID=2605428 RepID=UPI0011F2716B|nr:hypothetical protein [Dyadobacter sp. UC 10]KAA0992589.1 hypothetical protein FXO21_21650 [Dyadobacter sp. UC 10]
MEVVYKRKFLKEISKLSPKIQSGVKVILDRLKEASDLESSGIDYVFIAGQKAGQNYYRIRVGNYRIGIEYVRPDVIVILIASRGDV